MKSWSQIFSVLKRERLTWIRLAVFLIYLLYQISLIIFISTEKGDDHFAMQIVSACIGIMVVAFILLGGLMSAKQIVKMDLAESQISRITSQYANARELMFRIDSDTREEVGAWLHGTLQPQLIQLAKKIRTSQLSDPIVIADQIDEIGENYVRKYSHILYPPALMVSLEVGLETLLEDRAELILDKRLTNAAGVGFTPWSKRESDLDQHVLRLHLGRERAYAVYRIVEEAVANAEKKPTTTKITVEIRVEGSMIRISVRDNGSQIAGQVQPGLGLSIIDSYIQNLDGSMSINNVEDGVELIAYIQNSGETVADMLTQKFIGGGA